ncbi:hypothetical protein AOLI_G00114450 [Acnodon oligacanthus]
MSDGSKPPYPNMNAIIHTHCVPLPASPKSLSCLETILTRVRTHRPAISPTTSLQASSVFEAVSELRALSISGRCQGAQLWSAPLRGNHHTLSPCLISLTSISWLSEGSRSLHQHASCFNVGLPGRERARPAEPQARSAQSHQKVFGRRADTHIKVKMQEGSRTLAE